MLLWSVSGLLPVFLLILVVVLDSSRGYCILKLCLASMVGKAFFGQVLALLFDREPGANQPQAMS